MLPYNICGGKWVIYEHNAKSHLLGGIKSFNTMWYSHLIFTTLLEGKGTIEHRHYIKRLA